MELHLTQLHANTNRAYAMQESKRRRMGLVLCRFNTGYAYILVPAQMEEKLINKGRCVVVVQTKEKIPIVKQYMQMQMGGKYQTHRMEMHRYTATVVDINHIAHGAPLYICSN